MTNLNSSLQKFKRSFYLLCFLVLTITRVQSATITSTTTGGDWSTGSTWVGGVVPLSTDDVVIATTGGNAVTLSAPVTCVSLTINALAILTPGANLVTVNGDFSNLGTFTSGSGGLTISGTANQSISGFTTTGNISMVKTAGTATFTGNVNAAGLTLNGVGGTLNLGVGRTHTFTGTWTRTNGTLDGGSSTINFSAATVFSGTGGTFTANSSTVNYTGAAQTCPVLTYNNLTLSGSGVKTFATTPTVNGILSLEGTATVTVTTGVVTYGANATLQYNTSTARSATTEEWVSPFDGLGGVIIANTGAITMAAAKVLSDGVPMVINSGSTLTPGAFLLTIGGNFSNSGTFTSGSGGMVINGTGAQSIATFTTTGNVSVTKASGTATFTGNITTAALILNGAGSTLDLGSGLTHNLSGNLTLTAGTLNANAANITLSGTGNQSIAGFTTTGAVSMIKTGGTATFTGNVNAGALTINGTGGTLNLGTSLNHTFTGLWTRTNGTLNGGSSTLNLSAATVFSGTGGTFTPSTGTVNFTGTAQTCPVLTYNNLTLSNSGVKTFATTPTVNGILSMEGTATVVVTTGVVTYGPSATLQYNTTTSRIESAEEWITPFTATGGVVITNTGAISLSAAKVFNSGVPLVIQTGATLTPGSNLLTLGGNFTNSGTLTSGSGGITFSGTATQSVDGFTTTGTVSMTKTAGTATFVGNVNGAALTLNGIGGTLNLGTGLTHTFTGVWTRTNGTLDGGSSTLNLSVSGSVVSGTGGTFTPNAGTVNYSGPAQTVGNLTYNNLTLSGSGVKTTTSVTINGVFSLEGTASVSASLTYGPDATLRYNKSSSFTTSNNEFPASFTSTGGVVIANTGTIIFNASKTITYSLNINSGASIDLNAITTHTSNGLILGGLTQGTGTYGGTTSGAANIDPVYFAAGAGILTISSTTTTWTAGALTTNWSNPSNWSNGVPTNLLDAVIPNIATQPTLTADAECRALTIQAGATLTTANFQLTLFGSFVNNGTLALGSSNIVIAGIINQNIDGLSTTGNLTMTKTSGTATLTGNLSITDLVMNGAGGTLSLSSGSHAINGNITLTNGTLLGSNSSITLSGNFSQTSGTFTGNSATIILAGTATQSITGFTTTGNVSMTKTLGTATFTGAVAAGGLTLNGVGGTLNLGTSLSHTFSGVWTRTNGTLDGGSSTLNLTSSGVVVSGSGGTFTPNTGTVNYSGAAQTVGDLTYNNLTLSGSGTKTTAAVTVNGQLSMEGTATVSAAIIYGPAASLRYNRTSAYTTTNNEFPATFSGTGGVTIAGTGVITLNAAKTITGPLAINTGASLTVNTLLITLSGDFTRTGTFTSTTGGITFAGTANQTITGFTTTGTISMTKTGGTATFTGNVSGAGLTLNGIGGTLDLGTGLTHTFSGSITITNGTLNGNAANISLSGTANVNVAGFTTTGNISMVKTGGTATFTGNVNAAGLTMNGVGGTLNLGVGLTHTFTGTWTRTNGTLNGGSSTINFSGATVFSGTGGTFTPNAGTVNFSGSAQTCPSLTYNNLTISGSGLKTFATSPTVNGVMTMDGTATLSIAIVYGGDATLRYNNPSAYTTSNNEFPATFIGTGGVNIAGSGTISLNAAKSINYALVINTGSKIDLLSFNCSSRGLTLGGIVRSVGTYGGSSSAATNKLDVFFEATSTGILTNVNPLTIWTAGASTTDWYTAGNWSNGIPNSTLDVSIPNIAIQPTLTAAASCGELSIDAGATLSSANFQLTINGDLIINGSLSLGSSNIIIAGIINQSIAGFTTTGNVTMTKTGGTATFAGGFNIGTLTLNGAGGTLHLGSALSHVLNGDLILTAGTLNANNSNIEFAGTATQSIAGFTTTGNLAMTKTAGVVTFSGNISAAGLTLNGVGGTLNFGTGLTHTFTGNITNTAGTLTGNTSNIVLTGTATQSIAGFTTTGNVSMTKSSGTATFTGDISANGLTLNGTAGVLNLGASGITHTFTGNITVTAGTLTGNAANIILAGTANQSIAPFTTTGNLTMTKTGGTATLGSTTAANYTLNGVGGTLNLGATRAHAISGNLTVTAGTLVGSTATVTLSGNLSVTGTFTPNALNLTLAGTATQSIDGFTTTGNISMTKTAAVATFVGNVNANNLTINGAGGTLNLGSGLTHTFTGVWTRTAGTLNGGSSTLNLSATNPVSGSGGTFTPNTGTVNYTAADQTVGALSYNNLTLSGSGTKTTTSVTVNGVLSLEGTAIVSTSITYGGSATLRYNKPSAYTTTDNEFPPTFTGAGGVVIAGTGTITLNNSKSITFSLTVNTGATIDLNSIITHNCTGVVLGGVTQTTIGTYGGTASGANVINALYFGVGAGTIELLPSTIWTAGAATTDWFTASNWSDGIPSTSINAVIPNIAIQPTLTNDIAVRNLTINAGATLTSANFQITIQGNYVNDGTAILGSSPIIIAGTINQSIGPIATTGTVTMTKTAGTATLTGNLNIANLTLNGNGGTLNLGSGLTHTISENITRTFGTLTGNSANIVLTGTAPQAIPGFTTSGNLSMTKTGGTATIGGNLNVGSIILNGVGGTLNLGSALTHTINGDLIITNGTLTVGSSNITIAGTAAQSIAGFTTTGTITMTKTAGTATFTGNVSGAALTINGNGGTLDLGTGVTHTFSGTITRTVGTLTGNAANIILSGTAAQSIAGFTTTGTITMTKTASTATFTSNVNVGSIVINGTGGTLSLGAGFTHTINGDITITAGTLTGSSSNIILAGNSNQNIAGLTTTGNISMTKTGGTATLTGNINAAALTINGSGGTLNLGAGRTHTFSGNITLTSGTLDGGSSTLNANSSSTTAWNGTGSNFIASSGTINFGGGAQTIATATTFNNLTLGAAGTKTMGANVTVGGVLTFAAGTKLAIAANTLTLNGSISGMNASNNLVSNGSSNLTIGGSGALGTNLFFDQSVPRTTNRLFNFIVNRASQTITLGDTIRISGLLTPTAGTIASGGLLVIQSDVSQTGRIGNGGCSSCSYITGNIISERNIPASARRWRFFGPKVSGATLADLKNEIFITGPGGAANGFDASGTNAPTVYFYDETQNTGDLNTGWVAATNINNSLPVGAGVRIFIRGDRSDPNRLNGTNNTQNEVTMNLIGPPNMGDISLPVTFTSSGTPANDGWNLVSNPYPCPIDWNAIHDAGRTGSSPDFSGTDYAHLNHIVYIFSGATNSYLSYNAISNAGSLSSGIIPSGSAFWVKAEAGSPSLTVKEIYKSNTAPANVFKTSVSPFTLKLYSDSLTTDEASFKYLPEAKDYYDVYDIPKLYGADINLASIASDGKFLTSNFKNATSGNDTIPLSVGIAKSGTYTFEGIEVDNLTSLPVYLMDYYAGKIIDLRNQPVYQFSVDINNTATRGNERFALIVGKVNSTSLPEPLVVSQHVKLFPTVTSGFVTLQSNHAFNEQSEITVTDINGKEIVTIKPNSWNNNQLPVDLSDVSAGTYFIKVQAASFSQTLKCIKY